MQTEKENRSAVMTSSTELEHSGGELVAVVKRKRSKRPRHHPPASSASSSSESTTTEEEDMAHCLILLAQGHVVESRPSPPPLPPQHNPPPPPHHHRERYTSRKYTEAATTADGVKAGFYVYECKTCNKCFPTFQALGGHRASHKKPRIIPAAADDLDIIKHKLPAPIMSPPLPLPPPPPRVFPAPDVTTALSLAAGSSSNSKLQIRVHECSICGAEFSSGQALGGHMRRHRPLNAPPPIVTAMDDAAKKESINHLHELDLNLPAPSDDPALVLGLAQFNDAGNKLMLTASALVDCHY